MQVIASKYMNDEGELESLTNTEWAELGMPTMLHRFHNPHNLECVTYIASLLCLTEGCYW